MVILPWNESSGPLCHEAGSFAAALMVRFCDEDVIVRLKCDSRESINAMGTRGDGLSSYCDKIAVSNW